MIRWREAAVVGIGGRTPLRRAALPFLMVAVGAFLSASVASGLATQVLGRTAALLLLAAAVSGSCLVVFAFLDSVPVLVWPVAATVGYLLRLPHSHPVITFDRLWIGGMVAFIALTPRRVRRSGYTRTLAVGFAWFVVAYGMRSISTSSAILGPLATWIDAILLPAILFVACERYCLRKPDGTRQLLAALAIGGGVLATIGIAERVAGFQLATLTGGAVRFDAPIDQTRISGPYPVPEVYALSLLTCFAASWHWIVSRPRGSRFWPIALAALQAAAIGLTLFRAAWIGALLITVTAIGIRPGRFGRLYAAAAIVACAALVGTSALQQNRTFAVRTNNTSNIYYRLAAYEQGLRIFRSAPFFGVGVNRYTQTAAARTPTTVAGVEAGPYAHSSFISLLAEQGLFGALPFALVCFGVFRLIRGLRRASFLAPELAPLTAVVVGATLAYLTMSLTLTMLPYGPSNTFFAALLAVASARVDIVFRDPRDC